MKSVAQLEMETGLFKSYSHYSSMIIRAINNPFEKITDIRWNEHLIGLIDDIEKNDHIKSILFITDLEYCKEEYYDQFLDFIFNPDELDDDIKTAELERRLFREKQINLLDRLILRMVDFPKVSVAALQGSVVAPFLGYSLAADYRIASSNTVLVLSHAEHGVHPTGALPFFLNRFLNPTDCKKYLFEGGRIKAEKALELKLVDHVFPEESFEENCMIFMEKINRLNLNVVKAAKKLLNFKKDLMLYIESEATSYFD